jgi:hypothetical protein
MRNSFTFALLSTVFVAAPQLAQAQDSRFIGGSIGAVAGAVVAGPIGLLAGAALGYAFGPSVNGGAIASERRWARDGRRKYRHARHRRRHRYDPNGTPAHYHQPYPQQAQYYQQPQYGQPMGYAPTGPQYMPAMGAFPPPAAPAYPQQSYGQQNYMQASYAPSTPALSPAAAYQPLPGGGQQQPGMGMMGMGGVAAGSGFYPNSPLATNPTTGPITDPRYNPQVPPPAQAAGPGSYTTAFGAGAAGQAFSGAYNQPGSGPAGAFPPPQLR